MKDVLIIIPAFNEEQNIAKTLEAIYAEPGVKELADILVMNDASDDATNRIVREHGASLVTHVYNLGYGGGLQLGYKYAIRRGYKYVIQMDADGQHDPCNVLKIYERLTTADESGNCPDIVMGARFMKGSAKVKSNILKNIAYTYFRTIIKMMTGKAIHDPTTGLQGLNRKTFLAYSKYNHFDDKYPDTNVIVQMLLAGYNIVEIPAVMHDREFGASMHSGPKVIIYMIRMTLSVIASWLRVRFYKLNKYVR